MFRDALAFPRCSDDWLVTHLVGALLVLTSVLVLPMVVLNGYLVRVLRASGDPNTRLPSFTDWGGLFVDGLKLTVVNLAYGAFFLVPYALLLGTVGGGDLSASTTLALGALSLLAGLALLVWVPAALANFAREDARVAAFDVATVRAGVADGAYLKAVASPCS